jgi:hypothetical protein
MERGERGGWFGLRLTIGGGNPTLLLDQLTERNVREKKKKRKEKKG